MWIMTPAGIMSVVAADKPDGILLSVRARDKAVLRWMLSRLRKKDRGRKRIVETPERDYPYRVFMDRRVFAEFMQRAVLDIDYGNFKDASWSPDLHNLYLEVWWAIYVHYQKKR